MFEEVNDLQKMDPSEILTHQVHKTIAGFESHILSAIQQLGSIERWVSHKKLLELINITKKELYCIFENPYAIIRVYNLLQDMKQGSLDLVPEDFTWYNKFDDELDPVYAAIDIPLRLISLCKNDEELYAIKIAKEYVNEANLENVYQRKLEDIRVLVRYLEQHGYMDHIERLAHMGELIYPMFLQEAA